MSPICHLLKHFHWFRSAKFISDIQTEFSTLFAHVFEELWIHSIESSLSLKLKCLIFPLSRLSVDVGIGWGVTQARLDRASFSYNYRLDPSLIPLWTNKCWSYKVVCTVYTVSILPSDPTQGMHLFYHHTTPIAHSYATWIFPNSFCTNQEIEFICRTICFCKFGSALGKT